MPVILHSTTHRRSFLRTASFAGLATVFAGCRSPEARRGQAEEFHLALLSDTHIPGDRKNGHRGFNPWENLQRVVPVVVAAQPEGVIVCGDVARLEGKPEDYAEFQALMTPLTTRVPAYIALGNHDDRANFTAARPAHPGDPIPVDGKQITLIDHPVARFVILDSLLYTNKVPGLLGLKQRQWLAGYLARADDRPVVLFVHHTLGNDDGELLDATALFEIVSRHRQVKAIFYGHSHVWSLGRRDRVQLVNLPAVGYNFRDQDPVGWIDARFRATGVSLTLHTLGGNQTDNARTWSVKWT